MSTHKTSVFTINPPLLPPVYFSGPPLKEGPLPAVFYFALAGDESLTLDPYNQPALFLLQQAVPVRVFSMTLPGHEEGLDKFKAMEYWAEKLYRGENIIEAFVQQFSQTLDYLISLGCIDLAHISVAGLSRGAFIAAHAAAYDNRVQKILGFSPLTDLTALSEFVGGQEVSLFKNLSLLNHINAFSNKTIRFYIGNRDTRVGTNKCYAFIEAAAEAAYQAGRRSPPIELFIYPSIGHKGHGTPPHIFKDGANWIFTST